MGIHPTRHQAYVVKLGYLHPQLEDIARIHVVQRAFGRCHVVGRLEELDHDRRALVRVVQDLNALGRNIDRRTLTALNLGNAPGQVVGVDVRKPDHTCVHSLLLPVVGEEQPTAIVSARGFGRGVGADRSADFDCL